MNKKYLMNESGFSSLVLIIVVALLAVGGYSVYRLSSGHDVIEDKSMADDAMINESASPAPEAMMEDEGVTEGDQDAMSDGAIMELKFSGQKLAGTKSPLLDFNKADYNKALASDKLVVLYFYANGCPICKVEFPKMQDAFNRINDDIVIGFRVNYNDDQTDGDEKELAREFGIAYQHTKVFLKKGQRVLKAPESWDSADTYISKINEFK